MDLQADGETIIRNELADKFYMTETSLSYINQYRPPYATALISHNEMPTMITMLRI
jgi:hypothetical protein